MSSSFYTDGGHSMELPFNDLFSFTYIIACFKQLKQVKDRWMEYRLKADDSLNEHKLTSSRKVVLCFCFFVVVFFWKGGFCFAVFCFVMFFF